MNRDIGLRTWAIKPIEKRYTEKIQPAFYNLVGEASSLDEFLSKMPTIKKLCEPDCEVMREMRAQIAKRISRLKPGDDPDHVAEGKEAIRRADEFIRNHCKQNTVNYQLDVGTVGPQPKRVCSTQPSLSRVCFIVWELVSLCRPLEGVVVTVEAVVTL